MNSSSNIISPDDIEFIKANSFVRTVEFHRELPSTNDRALHLAAHEDLQTPLLVLAESQTAGRGRGSNQWWSTTGSLTFSLVISADEYDPTGVFDPRLSLITALAVHDALCEYDLPREIQLKWPNDVYLGARKVAGILLERPATRPDRLVVGIGININNSSSEAPEQIAEIATSLYETSGTYYAQRDVLCMILKYLAVRYQELAASELGLAEQWHERCFLRGRSVNVASGNRMLTGICHGIDDQGALLLHTDTGLNRVLSGVVQRIED